MNDERAALDEVALASWPITDPGAAENDFFVSSRLPRLCEGGEAAPLVVVDALVPDEVALAGERFETAVERAVKGASIDGVVGTLVVEDVHSRERERSLRGGRVKG